MHQIAVGNMTISPTVYFPLRIVLLMQYEVSEFTMLCIGCVCVGGGRHTTCPDCFHCPNIGNPPFFSLIGYRKWKRHFLQHYFGECGVYTLLAKMYLMSPWCNQTKAQL